MLKPKLTSALAVSLSIFLSATGTLPFTTYTQLPIQAEEQQADSLEYNAQRFYSVFKVMGLSDIAIAGCLGNWYTESWLDFTSIESIWTDQYVWTAQKEAATQDWDTFCQNTVWPAFSNLTINTSVYYNSADGKYYPGIGVGAFTGVNCYNLVNTAAQLGYNWYDADFQIAYIISDKYRPGVIQNSAYEDFADTTEAVLWYMVNWEGYSINNTYMSSPRPNNAQKMMNLLNEQNFDVDYEYAARIISLAQQIGATNISDTTISNITKLQEEEAAKKKEEALQPSKEKLSTIPDTLQICNTSMQPFTAKIKEKEQE
jgi:hypothetical protein